jgi:tetratricopeptide (TPR) repeat protein
VPRVRYIAFLAALTLQFIPPTAMTAGFVAGSRVSTVGDLATLSISFSCNVTYLNHDPLQSGDQVRILLDPTSVCRGVSPQAATSRELHRPMSADDASLVDIEYDGTSPGGPVLTLRFTEPVQFDLRPFVNATTVMVTVRTDAVTSQGAVADAGQRVSRRVDPPRQADARYVINLQSSNRPPATADLPQVVATDDQKLFVSTAVIDGTTWYRVRLGYFASATSAASALNRLRSDFPTAWIDRVGAEETADEILVPAGGASAAAPPAAPVPVVDSGEMAALMAEAKRAMTAGELSKAVQIYTKVLRQPESEYHPQAQEYLALARERNGQIAHAKAEYQRFIADYPEDPGLPRVQQRLAALVAQPTAAPTSLPGPAATSSRDARSPWTVRTFFNQFYRRDVNQVNDNDEIVSQSAVYSDINLDARRRGERFDFSARLNGGYRYDLLGEVEGSGDSFRVSYAYADLADAHLGLRGRLGRQSRNSGGVLGRFDGANFSYEIGDRANVELVAGRPVNSMSDGIDDARAFYGLSSTVGLFSEHLDVGVFVINQTVEDMVDRRAVGAEVRYFSEVASVWAMADYDTEFGELGSLFVQGSWRLPTETTLTGVIDRRRSPFLSASNALIGQQVADFGELQSLFTEDEIRQLALDRAAQSTTMTLGLSQPLSARVQLNVNASESRLEATPASGGVPANPASTYRYLSTDFVASSLLKEGDVSILGLRYAESQTNETLSLLLDARFPLGTLRINPRFRVDHREVKSDGSTQWTYTPGIRLQYRKDRRFRIELEGGMQFSTRELPTIDQERESWFVNAGYQLFF